MSRGVRLTSANGVPWCVAAAHVVEVYRRTRDGAAVTYVRTTADTASDTSATPVRESVDEVCALVWPEPAAPVATDAVTTAAREALTLLDGWSWCPIEGGEDIEPAAKHAAGRAYVILRAALGGAS